MTVTRLDIVAAKLQLGPSLDRRPWLVLTAGAQDRCLLLPISSALELFDPTQHFRLDPQHPDFPATGLRKASYIIGSRPVDSSTTTLEKRLGCLQGDLAAKFLEWYD